MCRWHGGAAPQVQAAAARRVAEVETDLRVRQILEAEGVEIGLDPLEELHRLIAETVSFKDTLGAEVERLRDLEHLNNFNAIEVRAVVQLYERACDRAGRLILEYSRLGLAERRVRIAEQQAQLVAGVVEAAILAMEPTPDQLTVGRRVASEKLAELAAAP